MFAKAPDPSKTDMALDYFHATLTSLMELELYALYLCSSPQRSACLLVEPEATEMKQVQAAVLAEMRHEWQMLQEMEASKEMHALLRKECPFVFFHHFREIPVCFDQNKWTMCPDTRACVQAWFPRFSWSSNIEDVFSSLQDACRRGVKNGDASLSNLQCVTVRAVQQKMDVEDGPNLVRLQSEDHEGNAIRSLKPRIWQPDSASPGFQTANIRIRDSHVFARGSSIREWPVKDESIDELFESTPPGCLDAMNLRS